MCPKFFPSFVLGYFVQGPAGAPSAKENYGAENSSCKTVQSVPHSALQCKHKTQDGAKN